MYQLDKETVLHQKIVCDVCGVQVSYSGDVIDYNSYPRFSAFDNAQDSVFKKYGWAMHIEIQATIDDYDEKKL